MGCGLCLGRAFVREIVSFCEPFLVDLLEEEVGFGRFLWGFFWCVCGGSFFVKKQRRSRRDAAGTVGELGAMAPHSSLPLLIGLRSGCQSSRPCKQSVTTFAKSLFCRKKRIQVEPKLGNALRKGAAQYS